MNNTNFNLICSDNERVPIDKSKLGAYSEVFGDIFSMRIEDGTQEECQVQDSSEDIKLMLGALESDGNDDWTIIELNHLVTLALKYGIRSILPAIKLNVAKIIATESIMGDRTSLRAIEQRPARSIAVACLELAARLEDDYLAKKIVWHTLPYWSELDSSKYLTPKWRQRVASVHSLNSEESILDLTCLQLAYRDRAALKIHQLLAERFVSGQRRRCPQEHDLLNKAIMKAMQEISKNPGKTPEHQLHKAHHTESVTFHDGDAIRCAGCREEKALAVQVLQIEWLMYEGNLYS